MAVHSFLTRLLPWRKERAVLGDGLGDALTPTPTQRRRPPSLARPRLLDTVLAYARRSARHAAALHDATISSCSRMRCTFESTLLLDAALGTPQAPPPLLCDPDVLEDLLCSGAPAA